MSMQCIQHLKRYNLGPFGVFFLQSNPFVSESIYGGSRHHIYEHIYENEEVMACPLIKCEVVYCTQYLEKAAYSVSCANRCRRRSEVVQCLRVLVLQLCVGTSLTGALWLSSFLQRGGGSHKASVLLQRAVKHCIRQDRDLQLLIRPAVLLWQL